MREKLTIIGLILGILACATFVIACLIFDLYRAAHSTPTTLDVILIAAVAVWLLRNSFSTKTNV